jgi:hypothetical protein
MTWIVAAPTNGAPPERGESPLPAVDPRRVGSELDALAEEWRLVAERCRALEAQERRAERRAPPPPESRPGR